ncbi:DDB1- and CUL4-associated factor 13 [Porphyridium purpureum]|uniref:DDB1-and CUL4-associated factor 13 n=1 Tax=Porphyridium purpureum TaxID=35688 RepID=A0A5J4Z6E1_PORPP|nr:DDB1- and CUL4-associated factor 13 [Porphyridium purpureum]|eukprot:POR8219..scf295_1
MKVKVLSRSEIEWTGELDGRGSSSAAPRRQQYNYDPKLHPMERAVEQKRALNAAKLERVFAKPFLAALSVHVDSPYAVKRSRVSTAHALSCAADGAVAVWNLVTKEPRWIHHSAHEAFARDVVFTAIPSMFLSCADDRTVKLWDVDLTERRDEQNMLDDYDYRSRIPGAAVRKNGDMAGSSAGESFLSPRLHTPLGQAEGGLKHRNRMVPSHVFMASMPLSSVDAHWRDPSLFVTSSDAVELWDVGRSKPIQRLSWGADAVHKVRYNPVEQNLLASLGADRSIVIYDVRLKTPVRKLVLSMRSNAVAWNPIEAFNFSVANEDHNVYTYDMRKLSRAKGIHTDHVRAVMDLDYSPTGTEIVTGSYDQTVRLFDLRDEQFGRRSREAYYTRRMQRVFGVNFSADAQMVMSASDDGDIRLWKAHASIPTKAQLPRERDAIDYAEKLKKRFQHVPSVRRILKNKFLPRPIHRMQNMKKVMKDSARRKNLNLAAHSKPGAIPHVPDKMTNIVRELE